MSLRLPSRDSANAPTASIIGLIKNRFKSSGSRKWFRSRKECKSIRLPLLYVRHSSTIAVKQSRATEFVVRLNSVFGLAIA